VDAPDELPLIGRFLAACISDNVAERVPVDAMTAAAFDRIEAFSASRGTAIDPLIVPILMMFMLIGFPSVLRFTRTISSRSKSRRYSPRMFTALSGPVIGSSEISGGSLTIRIDT